jgi:catechol 2,3-dioxygenase-like lactoylglutathione lyase family enzyme
MTTTNHECSIGRFSLSLTVKDLKASRSFYEKLGFEACSGDGEKWQVMQNGTATVGLFQGMFPRNMLTFNPGWGSAPRASGIDREKLAQFTDVRELQRRLRGAGIEPAEKADESGTGPGSFVVVDPDGNPILIDQHV